MYNMPGYSATAADELYRVPLAHGTDHQLERSSAEAERSERRRDACPILPVKPVTESDPAGTNFVLEEYCIDEQPTVWAQYVKNESGSPPPSGVPISMPRLPGRTGRHRRTDSTSHRLRRWPRTWPTPPAPSGRCRRTTRPTRGSRGPTRPRPSPRCRTRAASSPCRRPLTWRRPSPTPRSNPDGTHKLDFNGLGPNVYNPSTYSYLLTPTQGWVASKGATMSQFVNYTLTPRPAGRPEIRVRQPGPVARALRDRPGHRQCSRCRRPDPAEMPPTRAVT